MAGAGIPYMGSKRKLSSKIVDKILLDNPEVEYVYDLFGGGGAISLEFANREQIKEVHYNEIDKGISSLLQKLITDGVTEEMYNPITREQFFKLKDREDYIGGLIKTCWSFGTGGKAYLYGKKIESFKVLVHKLIVFGKDEDLKTFNKLLKFNFLSDKELMFIKNEDSKTRRYRILNIIREKLLQNNLFNYKHSINRLASLSNIYSLNSIKKTNNIKITSESYENVLIDTPIDKTIIYLDPPYKDTAKYNNSIDFKALYQWIRENKYKVYLSEYKSEFNLVDEYSHRSVISSSANKPVIEKLFCNKKEN